MDSRPYVTYKDSVLGKAVGKEIYGYQCVWLFKDYCNNVLDMNIKKSGNAKEIWTNKYRIFGPDRMEGDWVKNLMQWDILVSNNGNFGHVAIFDRYVDGKIYVLEQNGSWKNSGDGIGPNAVRVHWYTPTFFSVLWRSNKIIYNYLKEVDYIENKLLSGSDKDTLDYLSSIRHK